jgi:hypothetical protein
MYEDLMDGKSRDRDAIFFMLKPFSMGKIESFEKKERLKNFMNFFKFKEKF